MENLNYFTALIQLISAVNFAYITLGFEQKIFRLFFSLKRLLSQKFNPIEADINADIVSLQEMVPITTTDGVCTAPKIDTLLNKYRNFHQKWELSIKDIKVENNAIRHPKGIKSFFLLNSLYCIYDLFLIGLSCIFTNEINVSVLFFCTNSIMLIESIKYIIWIIGQKKRKDNADKLYKRAIIDFAIIVILPFVCVILNHIISNYIEPFPLWEWINIYIMILSILFPFLPSLVCVIYVIIKIRSINNSLDNKIKLLKSTQIGLRKEKEKLDSTYEVLSDNSDLISFS